MYKTDREKEYFMSWIKREFRRELKALEKSTERPMQWHINKAVEKYIEGVRK